MSRKIKGFILAWLVLAVAGFAAQPGEPQGKKEIPAATEHADALAGMDKPLPKEAATAPAAKAPEALPLTEEEKVAKAQEDILAIDQALKNMEVDVGRFPSNQEGLEALMEAPAGIKNWSGPYLKKLPVDPWGNSYGYRFPGWNNRALLDVFAKGHEAVANNWSK